MIIDFHTHAFPDNLAPRAISKLTYETLTPNTDGTVGGLLAEMKKSKVDASVVCNIATNSKQVCNVNNFAISQIDTEGIIPLGSIHPEFSEPCEELIRLKKCGIGGIKLHPDYMGYDFDDSIYSPILDACASYGMFVVVHAGVDICSPNHIHTTPDMILTVLARHPRLKLSAAHFGSNYMWDEVIEKLCGKNLYIDTSLAYIEDIPTDTALKIIRRHGAEKILFASDSPWCPMDKNIEYIEKLGLTSEEKDLIFHENAERLLGLKR